MPYYGGGRADSMGGVNGRGGNDSLGGGNLGLWTGTTWHGNTAFGPAGGRAIGYGTMDRSGNLGSLRDMAGNPIGQQSGARAAGGPIPKTYNRAKAKAQLLGVDLTPEQWDEMIDSSKLYGTTAFWGAPLQSGVHGTAMPNTTNVPMNNLGWQGWLNNMYSGRGDMSGDIPGYGGGYQGPGSGSYGNTYGGTYKGQF